MRLNMISENRKKIIAFICGISSGWFLVFFGLKIPDLYGFEPAYHPGEMLVMLAIVGFTFGCYLVRAMEESSISFIFILTLLGWVIASFLVDYPPFFYGGFDQTYAIALTIPAIMSITAYLSILTVSDFAMEFYRFFSAKLSWILLNIHIGYTYEWPLTQRLIKLTFTESPNFGIIFGWIIITGLWISMFVLIYGKLLRMYD